MYNIIIASVPYTILEVPPLALAVLKGAIESEGFTCRTVDLGMELFKDLGKDEKYFEKIQENFVSPETFGNDKTLKEKINDFIGKWATRLLSAQSDWIGISVFSNYSQLASLMLAKQIKLLNPYKKIVIGGPGVSAKPTEGVWKKFKLSEHEKKITFGNLLKNRKLIDSLIVGDGEEALVKLLKSGQHDGAENAYTTVKYQEKDLPYANFDDLELNLYKGQLQHKRQLPIFSSKGCVRNCDFCDIHVTQNKFRFRNGKNIVEEMIYLADRYDIRNFNFLDSLVNGSLKSLKSWVSALAEYNNNNPNKKITWSAGGWICRPLGQMPIEFYKTLADSGLENVSIGVESGSDDVLVAMNKKTNIEALHFEIEQLKKHNIKFMVLLVVGHWSETFEDFVKTCELMVHLLPYARSETLNAVNIGTSFKIKNDIPADLQRHKNGIISFSETAWWTPKNPQLTPKERFFRLLLIEKLLNYLKIPLSQQMASTAYESFHGHIKYIRKLYKEVIREGVKLEKDSEYYYHNIEEFIDKLIRKRLDAYKLKIQLDLEVETINDDPLFVIKSNNKVIFNQKMSSGKHNINLENILTESNQTNRLEFIFTNKNMKKDTIVGTDGKILKDKNIKIEKFLINGFDLLKDREFYNNEIKYFEDGMQVDTKTGFWKNNSQLLVDYTDCFNLWYTKKSNKNIFFPVKIFTGGSLPKNKWLTLSDQDTYRDNLVLNLNCLQF